MKKKQMHGMVRLFLALVLVLGIMLGLMAYDLWQKGLIPVKQKFQSPNPDYRVTTVERKDQSGINLNLWKRSVPISWDIALKEVIQLTWAPDGMSFFVVAESLEDGIVHWVIQRLEGEETTATGGTSRWGRTNFYPEGKGGNLIIPLTEKCRAHPGFPPGWQEIRLEFCAWGSDNETLIYHYTLDTWGEGFLEYHFPTNSITRVYNWE